MWWDEVGSYVRILTKIALCTEWSSEPREALQLEGKRLLPLYSLHIRLGGEQQQGDAVSVLLMGLT